MAEGRTPALRLVWEQIRYQNKLFWRTPVAAFFTLVFPLMFLLLFSVLFGTEKIELGSRGEFSIAQFYAPALAVFAVASATYTNIGIQVAIARDEGILKRIRGTPLPTWIYMAGRIGSAIWIATIATVLMMAVGILAFDVSIELAKLPAAVITFIAGAGCFAALGLTLATFSPTGDSAPAVANGTILPLAFVSDVFIVIEDPPRWLETIGNIFPLKHFVRAFQDAFHPLTEAPAFRPENLWVIGLWTLIGAFLAWKFFSWEPRESKPGRRRRRNRQAA
jgi:ABC-2 type transport system permease protein